MFATSNYSKYRERIRLDSPVTNHLELGPKDEEKYPKVESKINPCLEAGKQEGKMRRYTGRACAAQKGHMTNHMTQNLRHKQADLADDIISNMAAPLTE